MEAARSEGATGGTIISARGTASKEAEDIFDIVIHPEKAIVMNAEISKELLINIFSPLTPLHDGAVIIKGNKIRCAGAYYVLSTRETLDKTVGSRHRAALGIAEVTDSITIVVSEETGKISITYSGIIITITDKDKLLEYIDLAME